MRISATAAVLQMGIRPEERMRISPNMQTFMKQNFPIKNFSIQVQNKIYMDKPTSDLKSTEMR
jgi:hypothetical protein